MTIEYKDSKRIVGLSTDIVQTLTFEDDFSSDNWTNIEGSSVGVSGGVLAYNAYTGGGSNGDGEYRDYGSVLSDTFVWRFKWNATNIIKGSNLANNEVNISISSNTSKNDIVNDAVGFLLRVDSANKQLNAGIWDNTVPASTASTNTALEASTFSAGTYYCEVVRLSNRQFKFTLYSDSNFSTSAYTTTLTNPADLLDLRYFKVTTDHETSADSANDGSLDDFKLYNGVTSITSKPTNVQDNSLLVEKDTAKRYWFDDEFSKSNCKAYFTLDETSGNPANHATTANGFSDGNGINGTNGSTGATQNITGKFDKCFEFSGGNNEQVDMGNTILSGTTDFTLSGWINSSITSSGTYVIFNSYLGSATAGIQLYVNGSGNIIYWTSTGSITTSTATSGSNNSWDHVVVTKEGTSVKIYLNGAVDVSGTINHSITGGNFSIGGRSDGLYCFKGKIDEASVWTRALSASEVSELYNSGTGKTLLEAKTATWLLEKSYVSKSDCLAYYNFEQTSGNLINQATTANGFTGGLGSSADLSPSNVIYSQTGKVGTYSWGFNGSNTHAQGANLGSIPTKFTFAVWFKQDTLSNYQGLFSTHDPNSYGTNNIGVRVESNIGGSLDVIFGNDSNGGATYIGKNAGTISAGQWYFLVIKGNTSANTVDITLNDTTNNYTGLSGYWSTTFPDLCIGTGYDTYRRFDGLVDDFSYWDRHLTSDEISALYNSGHGIAI